MRPWLDAETGVGLTVVTTWAEGSPPSRWPPVAERKCPNR